MKNRGVAFIRKGISFAGRHQSLLPWAAGLIGGSALLCASAVAVADITSGSFQTASSSQVTTTSVTVHKPSSSTGDVMVATIAFHGSNTMHAPPPGWQLIASTTNDASLTLLSYWK